MGTNTNEHNGRLRIQKIVKEPRLRRATVAAKSQPRQRLCPPIRAYNVASKSQGTRLRRATVAAKSQPRQRLCPPIRAYNVAAKSQSPRLRRVTVEDPRPRLPGFAGQRSSQAPPPSLRSGGGPRQQCTSGRVTLRADALGGGFAGAQAA